MDLSFTLNNPQAITDFFSPSRLVCNICHEILSARPYGCSHCIALFCFECLARQVSLGLVIAPPILPKSMKCPLCRTETEMTPNGLIRFFMEKNKGSCGDCHAEMPLSELHDHTNVCPEGLINCETCGKIFIRKKHTALDCAFVKCHYCRQIFPKTEYQFHLDNTCPEIEIKCKFCSTFLKRAYMESHHNNFCPFAPRRCRFCGIEHYLREIHHHETYLCPERLIPCSQCGILSRVREIHEKIHTCLPN